VRPACAAYTSGMRASLLLVLVACHDTPDASPDATDNVPATCPAGSPLGELAAKPTLPITIGGRALTFIYDTGAPATYLDDAVRAQLGAGPYTLEVGGRTLTAATLPSMDIARATGVTGASGIIGTDLLGTSVVTLDRERMRFWIDDALDEAALTACSHAGAPVVAETSVRDYLYVRGQLEELAGWFLVDTGATLGAVPAATFDTLQAQHPRPAVGGFYTPAAIGTFWGKLATVGAMHVGAMSVAHLAVRTIPDDVLPPPPAPDGAPFLGLLPNGFLRHALVTVDYPNHRIRFAPYASDSLREPTFAYTIGISLAEQTTTPTPIATVLPGSAAAMQGVVAGDQILAVAGTDLGAIPLAQREWSLLAQGASIIGVTVRNAAGTRTLSLTAGDLLVAP